MNLVYVDIDQGIHKVKMKVAQNKKRKKPLGFSFYINIVNFEAFLRNLNLSTNHLFWRCDHLYCILEHSEFLESYIPRTFKYIIIETQKHIDTII